MPMLREIEVALSCGWMRVEASDLAGLAAGRRTVHRACINEEGGDDGRSPA